MNLIVFNVRVKLEGRFPEALLMPNGGPEAIDDEGPSNDRSGTGPIRRGLPSCGALEKMVA